MGGLPGASEQGRLRARRWDALILGSGTAALVAAARLGAAGHRVLVVEEDATRALHPVLREPFFLAGARDGGAVATTLRSLNIPLIDQRRVAPERVAYQVISPKFRIDIGNVGVTAEELVSWAMAEQAEASALVRTLAEAAEAERRALMTSDLVRIGRRLTLPRTGATSARARGSTESEAPDDLRPVLDAQVTALAQLASASPSPEARARLLGCALAGGAGFGDGPPWLLGLLRRRVETTYGELRSVAGRFRLVSVDSQPGIQVEDTGELWVGRTLIIAAAAAPLRHRLSNETTPDFLLDGDEGARSVGLHLSVHREVVPRGMGPRLIVMEDAHRGGLDGRIMTLGLFANPDSSTEIDLVARMRLLSGSRSEGDTIASLEDEMEARVRGLMPFSEDKIRRRPQRRPTWDDDFFLEDPPAGAGWPSEIDLRVSGRPPVYRLPRAEIGGLGIEGDLMLGWRAGDAVAAELG